MDDDELAVKTGARNSAEDKKRIGNIRAKAEEIVAISVELDPDGEQPESDQEGKSATTPDTFKACTREDAMGAMCFKIRPPGDWKSATLLPSDRAKVKALKPWNDYPAVELRVLGVPFGGPLSGRDSDGEAFTEDTNIWLRAGDEVPLTYIHGFGPDDPYSWQDTPAVIGVARYEGVEDMEFEGATYRGHVFTARVDPEEPLGARVSVAAAGGMPVRASSGAVGHLVRMGKAGLIDVWPVGELALFDTNEWRQPANDYAVVIPAKADLAEAVSDELAVETNESAEGDAQATVATAAKAETEESAGEDTELPVIEDTEMDEKEIQERIEAGIKAAMEAAAPVVKSAPAQKRHTEMGFSDEPKAAFTHWVKTGDSGGVKALVKGALQEATNEGLELTPDAFFPGIVEKRDEASIIRQPALGVQRYTTNARVFDIPAEGTSMTKFSQVAEEGAISAAENEPTFSTVAVTLYKFRKLVKVSEELLADDQTRNLETFLNNAAGRALADTENYYTLIGNGTTAPQGVFVGGTAGLTLDSATAIGPAEIPELFYKLAQPYRDNAYWVMAGDTEAYLRGLAGSTSFYYNPNPVTTGPMGWQELLGRPVINNSNCATKQASAKTLLIGNWAYYGFVERETIRVQRLVELYAGTGQIGLSFGVRFGGMVTQAEAFQYAKHPTA